MTIKNTFLFLGVALLTTNMPLLASAATLYSDSFNVDSSGSWTQNKAPTVNAGTQMAQFAYDYSIFGIPPAPGSGDTLGLRLRANIPIVSGNEVTTRPGGATSGLSVSPNGQDFGNSYEMQFYAWANFNGSANAQGLADNANSEGGTNNVLFAVGTAGNVPLVVGNTALVTNGVMDGVAFATSNDGGIASDYRAYLKTGTISTAASGVYMAGTVNDGGGNTPLSNANVFYTSIPSLAPHTAPAVQAALSTAEYGGDAFNTQLGSTQAGSFGFAWHKVVIAKDGNNVFWAIDDVLIAKADISTLTMGGGNIALGVSDVNTTTTRHPSLLFTVFDNLIVTDTLTIPEPASGALLGLALAGLGMAARRGRRIA